MFEEDDDYEKENEISDDEEDITDLNIDDDEKIDEETDKIKILTYKNILESIQKNPKKTLPIMTKFEKARVIGVRLQQLSCGAKPKVDITNLRNINDIVEEELKQRKIPFIIKRPLPNGVCEYWKMEEFELIN
jgi:DNA-directed RNA polymerase I, II, and III subunit RPABC2